MGFTLPRMLPFVRCALTTPFHPYHENTQQGAIIIATTFSWRYFFFGTFHRLAPSRRYLASYPVESRLSSVCAIPLGNENFWHYLPSKSPSLFLTGAMIRHKHMNEATTKNARNNALKTDVFIGEEHSTIYINE